METRQVPAKLLAQEALLVISAFSALLEKETAALRKSDTKTVDTLQNDKKQLAKDYEAKVAALASRKEEMLRLDPVTRGKLVLERDRFNKLLTENMRALELMQGSAKRLVDHILEAARSTVTQENKTHYTGTGKASAARSASLSYAIDKEL